MGQQRDGETTAQRRSRHPSAPGGLGNMIGAVLGGGKAAGAGSTTAGSAVSELASMVNLKGDGSPLDPIPRTVGKVMR